MNCDKTAKEMYELFPFPTRDPAEEPSRLFIIFQDLLDRISYYGFAGENWLETPRRILVAGGGSGDQLVFLAEQLRHLPQVELYYVDFSLSASNIARDRLKTRGLLTNKVTIQNRSISDLNPAIDGKFDYISCCGVLHHMPDPVSGLACLKSVLTSKGILGLMLYGKYGRTGVYQLRSLIQSLIVGNESWDDKIEATRTVIAQLPPSNWFKRAEQDGDQHIAFGDGGLADMLLTPFDQAYSVDDIYDMLSAQGLENIGFTGGKFPGGKLAYYPNQFLRDPKSLQSLQTKSDREKYRIAELVSGSIDCHYFYSTTESNPISAASSTENMIPYFSAAQVNEDEFCEVLEKNFGTLAHLKAGVFELTILNSPALLSFMQLIRDGNPMSKWLSQANSIASQFKWSYSEESFERESKNVRELFIESELVLLRSPSNTWRNPVRSSLYRLELKCLSNWGEKRRK